MGDDTSAAVMQLMPGLFNASGQLDPLAVASALAQLQHQQHEILPPGSGIGFPPDRSGVKKCGHCQVTSQNPRNEVAAAVLSRQYIPCATCHTGALILSVHQL